MKLKWLAFSMVMVSSWFQHESIAQENINTFPFQFFHTEVEYKNVKLAYIDSKPQKANGKSLILFHGKNFSSFYWMEVIRFLNEHGYRVIAPDQLGFGRSDKPDIHYSFHQMAANSKELLDSLQIKKVAVIGHSMGGILATRFTLMFPEAVEKLILENPIGLEDYKTFVPYKSLTDLHAQELSATYESYKKYQQTYYPEWKPEYEVLVEEQAKALKDPDFRSIAWANALTYQMIYEQPVVYEFQNIKIPVLLIIGTLDRTIVGKGSLPKKEQEVYGQYQVLGKRTAEKIRGSKLIELRHIGHIPHIQDPAAFRKSVLAFL
jgi:pimeloyl-ACP methyl ester carboxylesterase